MNGSIENMNEGQWDRHSLLKYFDPIEWDLCNIPNLNLETLDMDNCDLGQVPKAITELEYYAFRDIQAVSFNNNAITNADILGKLEDLEAINMCGTKLEAIPSTWSSLNKLTVLGLGHSRFISDFGPIKKLTNITWLDLGGCNLKTIPEEVTHLTKLVVLGLGDNKDIEIDDKIRCFGSLQKLALNNCGLDAIPKPIFSLVKLTYFHLDDNLLQNIDPEITHLRQLEELSVTGNRNLCLPKQLEMCSNLKRIVVDDTLNLGNISSVLKNKLRLALPDDTTNEDKNSAET